MEIYNMSSKMTKREIVVGTIELRYNASHKNTDAFFNNI